MITHNKTINIRTGYKAMYYLVENYYYLTNFDDIAGLAGDMALSKIGDTTIDPAAWEEWIKALDLHNEKHCSDEQAFEAMKIFLLSYANRIESTQIKSFVSELKWSMWVDALHNVK